MIFTFVFLGEMIFKIVGYGVHDYFLDPLNTFDAVIVILSMIEFTLDQLGT